MENPTQTVARLRALHQRTEREVAAETTKLTKLQAPAFKIEEHVRGIREQRRAEAEQLARQALGEAEERKRKLREWVPQLPDEWKPTTGRAVNFIDGLRRTQRPGDNSKRFFELPVAELVRRAAQITDPLDLHDLQLALQRRAEAGDQNAADAAASIDLVAAAMAHPHVVQAVGRYAEAYKTVMRLRGTLGAIATGGPDEGVAEDSYDVVRELRASGARGQALTQPDGTLKWEPNRDAPQPFIPAE